MSDCIRGTTMASQKKSVMMVIPHMVGGGAERVAAMLTNEFHRHGYEASLLLTSAKREEVINRDLKPEIPLLFLQEMCGRKRNKARQITSSVLSHLFEDTGHAVPASIAYLSFISLYENEIDAVRRLLLERPETTVIAFSQPAIPIVLLAAQGLPNRIVISERADPTRLMKHRYGSKFIEKYYPRADAAVFQTEDAKNTYPACVSGKGTVISNPLKADLPAPYHGARNKNITTFCRISAQKNLPVLFEAFRMLHRDYPAYTLRVIGDASNDEGKAIKAHLKQFIQENGLEQSVVFEPFMMEVHQAVIRDAMYVNSSDYEGISNAMLEAMAIGMPVVCTDCPIGGAKATITDGENGFLVPIKDPDALYRAMKRIIEEPGLADKLSHNAAKLRDMLSLEKTAEKWMELL